MNTLDHYVAIIGVDWADKKYDLCLRVTGSDDTEYSVLPHQAQAIEDWAIELQQRFPDSQIAIWHRIVQGAANPSLRPGPGLPGQMR